MKIVHNGFIYESSNYIGNCTQVGGNSRAPICKIFNNATEMAQSVYDPDSGDLNNSTEISKEEFEKHINPSNYPKKMLIGDLKYFYISEGITLINWEPRSVKYSINDAKIFYVYNINQDLHYFFQQTKSLYESAGGRTLISVDIQPDYEKAFGFQMYKFAYWLESVAEQFDTIIFLFNGPDLGFPSEDEYKNWLYENDISEDLMNRIQFFDKGYAFFRNAIDAGLDENEIVKLIQYMMRNHINDSREIDEEAWQQIGLDDSLIDHMKDNEDALFIPDVLSFLSKVNGHIDLVGGGVNECLKEVELCLRALNKPFNLINEWTY